MTSLQRMPPVMSQEASSAVMSDTVNMLDEDLKENHTGFKGI